MYYGLINSMSKGGVSYTARTTAFATATGITDVTILGALNTFDLGLISNSLDTKMKAVYPFVDSTSTTQKYNFMDARDLDVAFRLQFNGGITFSNNGVQFGGVNGWANTFIQPSSVLLLNSTHVSIYSRSNTSKQQFDVCTYNVSNYSPEIAINFGGTTYIQVNQNSSYSTIADSNSSGFRLISRVNSTTEKLYKNNSLVLTSARTSTYLSPGTINIGRYYDNSYFSDRQYCFMSVGDGLTDGEATTFYNLVQAMQTTLNRQV
jgi:hypothetical protein